jgi:hypothetical protein
MGHPHLSNKTPEFLIFSIFFSFSILFLSSLDSNNFNLYDFLFLPA